MKSPCVLGLPYQNEEFITCKVTCYYNFFTVVTPFFHFLIKECEELTILEILREVWYCKVLTYEVLTLWGLKLLQQLLRWKPLTFWLTSHFLGLLRSLWEFTLIQGCKALVQKFLKPSSFHNCEIYQRKLPFPTTIPSYNKTTRTHCYFIAVSFVMQLLYYVCSYILFRTYVDLTVVSSYFNFS